MDGINNMNEERKIPIVPLGPGEAHLQNIVLESTCYICGKEENDDMAMLHIKDKQLGFACLDHRGVIQEFIKQFNRPPLGWQHSKRGV